MEINEVLARKMNGGREYRRFDAANLEARTGGDENACIVEGYATTFNTPYEIYRCDGYTIREEIDARSFDGCDMSDTIMQYDHQGRVFARVSNRTLTLTVDSKGLKIRADLSGTELGRQLYQEIRDGYTTKMSFGFIVERDERIVTNDHTTGETDVLRRITSFRKLYDVSAVSLPANDTTEISARGYCDGVIAELTEESRKKRALEILNLRIKMMEVK